MQNAGLILMKDVCEKLHGQLTSLAQVMEKNPKGHLEKAVEVAFPEGLSNAIGGLDDVLHTLAGLEIEVEGAVVSPETKAQIQVMTNVSPGSPCIEVSESFDKAEIDPDYKFGHISVMIRVPVATDPGEPLEVSLQKAAYLARKSFWEEFNKSLSWLRVRKTEGFHAWMVKMNERYPLTQEDYF